jgi:hypothetical protein
LRLGFEEIHEMPLRDVLKRITSNKYFPAGCVLAVGALWATYSHSWVNAIPELPQSVEAKWNAAIRDLGVEPVYPPEEDIEVGDVFAIVSYDSLPENGVVDTPIANHAVRLWRMDLSQDVNHNYKDIYVFDQHITGGENRPSLPQKPVAELPAALVKYPDGSEDTIFRLNDHRTSLPLVTFPKFIISKSRSAGVKELAYIFGLQTNSDATVETEVSIKDTQTYGIPYLVAERALVSFCKDLFPPMCNENAVRKVLSTRIGDQIYDIGIDKKTNKPKYRMTVELGLINRVFLTQKIETRLIRNQGFSASANYSAADVRDRDRLATASAVSSTTSIAAAAENSGQNSEQGHIGTAQDESKLAVDFDGSSLIRPVVFGFESVRYSPAPTPIPIETQRLETQK